MKLSTLGTIGVKLAAVGFVVAMGAGMAESARFLARKEAEKVFKEMMNTNDDSKGENFNA